MEDDKFEWNQYWIDQYWREADETVRVRNEEMGAWTIRGKQEERRRGERVR